jgi:hypothetical protein
MLLVTGFMLIGLNSSTATEVQTRTDSGIFCGGVRIAAVSFRRAARNRARDFSQRNSSQIRNEEFPVAKQKGEGRRAKEILKPLQVNDLKLVRRRWHGLCIRV